MAKIRIFQIAKELNISHTDILSFLKSKKIQVSSHMSPVEEKVKKMIMDEFAKDKEQVDRFRKEKVRREIHDTKLKEQQQSTKKLKLLSVILKYYEGEPVIKDIKRVSKPGRRVYSKADSIPKVLNGLGVAILSTSKGVMSDAEAIKNNLGGEIICRIF